MTPDELKDRTKTFALQIIALVGKLPRGPAARVIGSQLVDAGTAVGSNYRSACRARSRADSTAKMAIVEEEADESLYWLELLGESGLADLELVHPLQREADELVAIFSASRKTAREGSRH